MRSLVVCVDYDDFLAITLPRNKRHFSETLVVTAPHDERTQTLAVREGCRVHVTDAFYRDGAAFNKGAATEEAFDVLGRHGWFVVWDADIVMQERLELPELRTDCLYVPARAILEDPTQFRDGIRWASLPCPTKRNEFDGYFQLFHAAGAGKPPWYSVTWKHAGGCDSDFSARYPTDRKVRLTRNVLHLGPEGFDGHRIGKNWHGRVVPRIDTGEPWPRAIERENAVRRMVAERRQLGLKAERIKPSQPLPNRMAWYWSGPMSWMRYLTLSTFRMHNPGWQMVVYSSAVEPGARSWQSHERDDAGYSGFDYRSQLWRLGVEQRLWRQPEGVGGPAHASDLCGWWYLANEGGWYSDMDILWLRPMQDAIGPYRNSDAVFCMEDGYLAIGLLAGRPCGLWREVWESIRSEPGTNYQHYGTDALYRYAKAAAGSSPVGIRAVEAIRAKHQHDRVQVMPDATVYPFDWRQIADIFERTSTMPTDAVGMHWFGGDEISQRWNRLLTPANWREYRNAFTQCLEALPCPP